MSRLGLLLQMTVLWIVERDSFSSKFRVSSCFRLHRMHEMQTIVSDVCGVCQSVCHVAQLTQLHCARVIRCSLCQMTLASCLV